MFNGKKTTPGLKQFVLEKYQGISLICYTCLFCEVSAVRKASPKKNENTYLQQGF